MAVAFETGRGRDIHVVSLGGLKWLYGCMYGLGIDTRLHSDQNSTTNNIGTVGGCGSVFGFFREHRQTDRWSIRQHTDDKPCLEVVDDDDDDVGREPLLRETAIAYRHQL